MIFLFSSFKLMQKVLAVGPLQITKSSKLSRIKSIFDAHKECRCFDLGATYSCFGVSAHFQRDIVLYGLFFSIYILIFARP
jgi:hypothetical protein